MENERVNCLTEGRRDLLNNGPFVPKEWAWAQLEDLQTGELGTTISGSVGLKGDSNACAK